uniref:C2 domain-containing protein n=1 Tax=Pygocentrus nattereri TaxID=42514 RepID=A0A3B4EF58_PYGNA
MVLHTRRLRNSVPDHKQLKVLSGEWFEELRSKRYGRQPAISAVVRSSMRWKKSAVESTAVEIKPKATDGNMPVETLAITSFSETRDASSQDQSRQPGSSADSISTGPKVEAGEIISSRKVTKIEVKQKQARTVTEPVMNKDGSGLGEERTGSLLSVYSDAGDFGNVVVQGSVEFALMYSPLGELVIMVEQCQDLAIANPRKQRTDPYVKTYLYPDKRSKRKTSIKKRTLNPVFVESLRVCFSIISLQLCPRWYEVQGLGTGEIHVWLREARQLRRLKAQAVDSFVKCYMLPDTSKKSRQKTRVMKKSLNPVYNHTMVYDGFRPDEVREACCELTVWDNNKLSNQFLGGLRLSLGTGQSYGKKVDWMDSANEEVEVWQKMMAKPNSWVEADLPLRASMTPRK